MGPDRKASGKLSTCIQHFALILAGHSPLDLPFLDVRVLVVEHRPHHEVGPACLATTDHGQGASLIIVEDHFLGSHGYLLPVLRRPFCSRAE